jgi:hypothetical protein
MNRTLNGAPAAVHKTVIDVGKRPARDLR